MRFHPLLTACAVLFAVRTPDPLPQAPATAMLRFSNTMASESASLGVNDTVVVRDLSASQTSGYITVPDSTVQLKLYRGGGDSVLVQVTAQFMAGKHYTVLARRNADGNASLAVQADSIPAP